MTNKLGNLKKAVFAAAILLAAVPFLAPIQAQASNVTITSGTLPVGQGARSFLVIIQGTGFKTGAVATISGTQAWLKNPLAFQGTTLYAYATVAPKATSGARTLTVTNPDGSSAQCTGCVVIDPAPVVTAIDSLQTGAGQAGSFAQSINVHGTGFVPGLGRVFVKGAGIVAWPAVAVTSSTEATVGMVVSPQAAPGRYDVTFTNGDVGVGRCAGCFTVAPGPRLDGMTPGSFLRGIWSRCPGSISTRERCPRYPSCTAGSWSPTSRSAPPAPPSPSPWPSRARPFSTGRVSFSTSATRRLATARSHQWL